MIFQIRVFDCFNFMEKADSENKIVEPTKISKLVSDIAHATLRVLYVHDVICFYFEIPYLVPSILEDLEPLPVEKTVASCEEVDVCMPGDGKKDKKSSDSSIGSDFDFC